MLIKLLSLFKKKSLIRKKGKKKYTTDLRFKTRTTVLFSDINLLKEKLCTCLNLNYTLRYTRQTNSIKLNIFRAVLINRVQK